MKNKGLGVNCRDSGFKEFNEMFKKIERYYDFLDEDEITKEDFVKSFIMGMSTSYVDYEKYYNKKKEVIK